MTTAMATIVAAAVAVTIAGMTIKGFYSDDMTNLRTIIGETQTATTSNVVRKDDPGCINSNKDNIINDNELDCQMRQLFYDMSKEAVPWRTDMSDVYNSLELDGCAKQINKMRVDAVNVVEKSTSLIESKKNVQSTIFHSYLHTSNNRMNTESERMIDQRRIEHGNSRHNVTNNVVFYVCPITGTDDASNRVGDKRHPFETLERALEATRNHRRTVQRQEQRQQQRQRGNAGLTTIVMKPGIHYLQDTIVLRPEDSNVRLISERLHHSRHHNDNDNDTEQQRPWISGGILIPSKTTPWKKWKSTDKKRHFRLESNKTIWVADLSFMGKNTPSKIMGLFTVGSRFGSDGTSGIEKHERMTLARYPNADVEEWNANDRYMSHDTVHEWIFHPSFGDVPHFEFIDLSLPDNPTGHMKNDSTMDDYNSFGTGQGGACATVWGDLPSYWCGNVSAGGWAEVDRAAALSGRMNIPVGMVLQSKSHSTDASSSRGRYSTEESVDQFIKRVQQWSKPQGGIVHVSHTQGWAWHMFGIQSADSNRHTATIHFEPGGGSQGGRNWQCKDREGHLSDCNGNDKKLAGGDWYVEGIFEELDAEGEFYYDQDQKLLFFIPKDDCSDSRGADDSITCIPDLVATDLQTLIKIEGQYGDPVKNIEMRGLGFRDAEKTYLEQWHAPSGGDWSLHRGGAIHLEGAEHVTVLDSYFHRLDGNAVFLGGYSHKTKIARCDFAWIGNGAIATWGDTVDNGYDATLPTQPRHSLIENNVFSNLGLYQKQSSAWGQSKSCLNVVRNNVMFDMPRAAINFNDGLGGGNVIERNIIFNTCRESGDHGPINR